MRNHSLVIMVGVTHLNDKNQSNKNNSFDHSNQYCLNNFEELIKAESMIPNRGA